MPRGKDRKKLRVLAASQAWHAPSRGGCCLFRPARFGPRRFNAIGATKFGPLYPPPRGATPARATLGAIPHVSAYAEAIAFLAQASLGAVGVLLAVVHVI